jgi:enoyl-CoA hydratase
VADPILEERRGAVALLTLNRPDVLNALDRALLEALRARVGALAEAPELGAVVVTGAGRAFAAGADIAEMRSFSALDAEAFSRAGHAALAALEDLGVPTIAAVNGYALGGGCELALACDWIYAARKARFGQPEVKLGILPGFGGTSRLLRRVGPAWAKELVLGGEPIGAEEAARIGLVNRVFDDAEAALAGALETAQAVAQRAPLAVRQAKRVLQQGQDADVRVAHTLEQQAFAATFGTDDRAEGMAAFLEKREPKWRRR